MKNGSGIWGETYAEEQLKAEGYRILQRNYHSRWGEIALIAQKDGYLCFIEVKTRQEDPLVSGVEAVTAAKQRRILRTALCYLAENDGDLQPRFDLFEIYVRPAGGTETLAAVSHRHLRNAFEAGGEYALF